MWIKERGNFLFIYGDHDAEELVKKALVLQKRVFDPINTQFFSVPHICYETVESEGKKIIFTQGGYKKYLCELLAKGNVSYTIEEDKGSRTNLFPFFDQEKLQKFSLRDDQLECLYRILSNKRGIIKAPVGFGKSFLFPVIASVLPEAKIDIVVSRRDVARAIYKSCIENELNPGLVTTGSCVFRRVTIYTSPSLVKSKFNADVVLVDECHEAATERIFSYLSNYIHANMYGFSATPNKRYDNGDFLLTGLFGEIIYESNYKTNVASSNVVPIVIRWITFNTNEQTRRIISTRGSRYQSKYVQQKRYGIWRNSARNEKIAEVATEYFKNGRQTLIIVETVEHALALKSILPEFHVCTSANASAKLRENDYSYEHNLTREKLFDKFKNREIIGVIATDVWSTGVSFNDLEILIRADERASEIKNVQIPGRVSRIPQLADKEIGLVIDFVDPKDASSFRKAEQRFKIYSELGWLQCNEKYELINSLRTLKTCS